MSLLNPPRRLAMWLPGSAFVCLFAVLLASVSPVHAQEVASTNRATELKSGPAFDATTVVSLPANTSVQVTGRRSGWTQVKAGEQTGWVRAFHLRFQSTVVESAESGKPVGGLLGGLFGGRQRAAPKQTATVGIRGLSTAELQTAAPNLDAVKTLQGFRADRAAAESAAREVKLQPTRVAYAEGDAPLGDAK